MRNHDNRSNSFLFHSKWGDGSLAPSLTLVLDHFLLDVAVAEESVIMRLFPVDKPPCFCRICGQALVRIERKTKTGYDIFTGLPCADDVRISLTCPSHSGVEYILYIDGWA